MCVPPGYTILFRFLLPSCFVLKTNGLFYTNIYVFRILNLQTKNFCDIWENSSPYFSKSVENVPRRWLRGHPHAEEKKHLKKKITFFFQLGMYVFSVNIKLAHLKQRMRYKVSKKHPSYKGFWNNWVHFKVRRDFLAFDIFRKICFEYWRLENSMIFFCSQELFATLQRVGFF